jgi:hypothetical protein
VLKKVKGLLGTLLGREKEEGLKERGLLGSVVGGVGLGRILDIGWGGEVVRGRGGLSNDVRSVLQCRIGRRVITIGSIDS